MRERYETRIVELESKIAKGLSINRQLETRRCQDREGFVNDVSMLRKKLSMIERRMHQMRLIERLSEDDRLDRMLQDLENKMPNLGPEESDYGFKLYSTESLVDEAQKIQKTLFGIEERLKQSRCDS